MSEVYSIGLKSVKYGTPTGTAAMPNTLTSFAKTVKGSMTISEKEPTVKEFKVEETSAPVKRAITEDGVLELKWKAYDLTPTMIVVMKGGDSATSKTYKAPANQTLIDLALEITTDDNVVVNIPKASIIARIDGAIGAEDMIQLDVSAMAIDPGDGGVPWYIVIP